VPSQFGVACIPSVLPGANPYAQDRGNFDPNVPLFSAGAFQPVGSFNFYYGDGPRVSNLRGFGFANLDFGITKNFRITERWNIQIRGEAFNVFNSHSFMNYFVSNLQSPSFGNWNGSVTAPRNLQLGGKITF
jgi:hypothetical protein